MEQRESDKKINEAKALFRGYIIGTIILTLGNINSTGFGIIIDIMGNLWTALMLYFVICLPILGLSYLFKWIFSKDIIDLFLKTDAGTITIVIAHLMLCIMMSLHG